MLLLSASQAIAASECNEQKGAPAQKTVKSPRQLEANSNRPTLTVPLDGSTTGTASVTLPVKEGKRVAATARDKAASADISDVPQRNNRDLSGRLAASATPTGTGTGVVVRVCVSGNDEWKAGKYEGTVSVYGPRFTEFSYPIIATQKWPLWVPLLILGVVLIPIGILELRSDATTKGGTALYILVGLIAGFFTLGSQYTANDTWGDDWAKQIVALAVAAATAAVAGRAAATKFFTTPGTPRRGGA